ncbi:hypothetical protein AVEN_156920-1 [Araneus ventricosus]|uniref:Uncharacterized protein n=1 Tax=Araneus ventricosus TaxID=182803 RepID=A0A4Y2EKL3_ARAVE|nr:hypothetical protein AVEN_156920-1 [Araneus ventricosus]
MEDRLNKLEERQNSQGKTYAEVAKDKTKAEKAIKKPAKNIDREVQKQPVPVNESVKQPAKATAATVAKTKHSAKPANQTARQPVTLKPKPVVSTLIVKPIVEGATYKDLKSKLEEKINLKSLGG